MAHSAACCRVHEIGKCDNVFTCCDRCPTFFGPDVGPEIASWGSSGYVVIGGPDDESDTGS